jgi:hypothetical protein
MSSTITLKQSAILAIHAIIGWAYCGAIIAFGRRWLSLNSVLTLHAIGAPIGFAVLSWIYHRKFGFTRPLITAIAFVGIVITLDFFVVALLVEHSFAMFGSLLGTWLPFILIFAATFAAGEFARTQAQGSST